MRGQRLFVRPMEAADAESIRLFLETEGSGSATPTAALLGKLVGNLVAVLAMEVTPESVLIRDLIVARDFRRKRIGRFMLDELDALAAKMDRSLLVFECGAPPGFLQRVGFENDGGRMVRRVRR